MTNVVGPNGKLNPPGLAASYIKGMSVRMTTDEKIAVLAQAILDLAEKAARERGHDGQQIISTGVTLTNELEAKLREIAESIPRSR